MFDLFGAAGPLAVRFFLAFVIVLVGISVAAWAVRRLGSAGAGHAPRGRLQRLGVSDYAAVDSRRRLVLVRRDNVEHLVMIGGPADVVVESNIARHVSGTRELTILHDQARAEMFAPTLPRPEEEAKEAWPLQPEQKASPPLAPLSEPAPEQNILLIRGESWLRAQRGAADLHETAPPPFAPEPLGPIQQRSAPSTPLRPHPLPEQRSEVARDDPQAPGVSRRQETERSAADEGFAEMAQRLETALRKPKSAAPTATAPAPQQTDQPKDAASGTFPRNDHLEQEMASLLGRRPKKT
jgi:flagellar biogenesis protein FliO